jgi:hypothetical protein
MAVLLATAAATLFMTGLGWFVQVVHYPLMGSVGGGAFERYHQAHSRLTGRVILGPMVIELAGSALLVVLRPPGVGALAAWAGLALAAATWVSTAVVQVPRHQRLTPDGVSALVAGSWPRTLAWTAHSGVVLGMLAAAA